MSFGEFQRGERVGGLSGLRYKDRQIAGKPDAGREVGGSMEASEIAGGNAERASIFSRFLV